VSSGTARMLKLSAFGKEASRTVFGTGLGGGGWKRGGCANTMGGELDKGGLVPSVPAFPILEDIMPDRRPPGNWMGRSKFPDHR
jgi:hypothetical protein